MAIYRGYTSVPHSTYDEWRNATNGNGYDVDYSYGSQCWDFASLFWWNVGFPTGYPLIHSSSAYTMWDLRDQNIAYNGVTYFDLVYNLEDVKRGDIIVYTRTSSNIYGHVGFADEDYVTWHSNHPGDYEFPILSENNGGIPDPQGGACANIHGYDTRLFRGAFRYKAWETTPPTPPSEHKKHHFPWVLYERKLRENRQFQ